MKRSAFTFLEVLSIVVILGVVSTVLMPVLANAQLGSKSRAAKENLRAIWRGMKIYQSNYDEKVEFGDPKDMGLPSSPQSFGKFIDEYTGDYHHSWYTKQKYLPCGVKVTSDDFEGLGYSPMYIDDWAKYAPRLGLDTVVMYDKNCNRPGTRVMCQFCSKRSIGVTLSGLIRDRMNSDYGVKEQLFYR